MGEGTDSMLAAMMERARLAPPDDLMDLARAGARWLGLRARSVLLVDMEQRVLQPFPGSVADRPQGVDATLAGRAYRTLEPVEAGRHGAWLRLLLPLLDGSERLGVLEVEVPDGVPDAARLCEPLTVLVTYFIVSKRAYGDVVSRSRRRRDMRLAAEIQWELLPPLTLATPAISVSGILEPCYEIGGDAFDYALNDPMVHLLLVDAMGHGLDSSMLSSLAVGAYRHCRRKGDDLAATYRRMNRVVSERFGPDAFATAQLAEFDRRDGELWWINAGHPPPLLVREGSVVGRLEEPPCLPIGLADGESTVGRTHLQPGDAILWFTDGVVEARSAEGGFFGEDRLADLLERAFASELPLPEIARRLVHAVLDHQRGDLQDDATMLLLAWHPDAGGADAAGA